MSIRFKGLIAPTEVPTGDGRMFAAGKASHRPMPLPFMAQFGSGGHAGASPVAKIESLYPGPGGYWGEGPFLDPRFAPEVPRAVYMIQQGVMGPSVDLDRDYTVKSVPHPSRPDKKAALFEEYNIIGCTLVPMPAFYQVHMSVDNDEEKSLLASAGVDLSMLLDHASFLQENGIEQVQGKISVEEYQTSFDLNMMQVMDLGPKLPFTVPGVTEASALVMIGELQVLLAKLTKLMLTLKHSHWNITGPQFIALHKMLDKMAANASGHVDEVAERIAALGGSPNGTLSGLVTAIGIEDDRSYGRAGAMVILPYLDHCYTTTISKARECMSCSGEYDLVTQDMLTGQLQSLEKDQWFIRAHLEQN